MEPSMKLNSERLRSLREAKGWAQDQLAAAAGVSLRTVQRAEGDGSASRETKVCLAAALGIPHMDLEAPSSSASLSERTGRQVNASALVHTTLGTSFMIVGLAFLSSYLFFGYSPVMIYLGSVFAASGATDLFFAWRAVADAGRSATLPHW
jgi:DNA-binding XRE family transcriptional regulator